MLIRFPTGLYNLQGAPNVTYTISTQDPPTSSGNFLQLPAGIERRLLALEMLDRRGDFGDLAFTVAAGGVSAVPNGAMARTIGEVLGFDDVIPTSPQPSLIPNNLVIQHNTNLIDLVGLGITIDPTDAVRAKFNELSAQLNRLRASKNSVVQQINDITKKITEAQKARDALNVAGLTDVVTQLDALVIVLSGEIAALQQDSIDTEAAALDVTDQLRQLGALLA